VPNAERICRQKITVGHQHFVRIKNFTFFHMNSAQLCCMYCTAEHFLLFAVHMTEIQQKIEPVLTLVEKGKIPMSSADIHVRTKFHLVLK
jgi:hypothetical protein